MKTTTKTVAQSNAFVTTFDLSPTDSGLLNGLRFAVKDTIDVAGFKTGCGNPTWRDSHPAAVVHAVCVEQLLHAGARCIGKTVSDENHFYSTPFNSCCEWRRISVENRSAVEGVLDGRVTAEGGSFACVAHSQVPV